MALLEVINVEDSFARFQKDFEIFANAQAAEIEAVRSVLQTFVAHILRSHPDGTILFGDLRQSALARLERETTLNAHDQNAARKAAMVLERAERIFDELQPVFGAQTNLQKN